jgi:hypothetical protein
MTDMPVVNRKINVRTPENNFMPEKQTSRGKRTDGKNEDDSICLGGIPSRDYQCFMYRVVSRPDCDLSSESLTANDIPNRIAKVVLVLYARGFPQFHSLSIPQIR